MITIEDPSRSSRSRIIKNHGKAIYKILGLYSQVVAFRNNTGKLRATNSIRNNKEITINYGNEHGIHEQASTIEPLERDKHVTI